MTKKSKRILLTLVTLLMAGSFTNTITSLKTEAVDTHGVDYAAQFTDFTNFTFGGIGDKQAGSELKIWTGNDDDEYSAYSPKTDGLEPNTLYQVIYNASFEAASSSYLIGRVIYSDGSIYCPDNSNFLCENSYSRDASFTFLTKATNPDVQIYFTVKGKGAKGIISNVRLLKMNALADCETAVTQGEYSNNDFENVNQDTNAPYYWNFAGAGSNVVLFETDSTVYHKGSKSAHIIKDGNFESSGLYSSELIKLIDNKKNTKYEFSAWIRSKNCDPQCRLTYFVYFYDAQGQQIRPNPNTLRFQGSSTVLNGGSSISDWKQISFHMAPCYYNEDAAYVSYFFAFSQGSAEVWIDDVDMRIFSIGTGEYDDDGEEYVNSVLFEKDFSGYKEDGTTDWVTSGDASLTKSGNSGVLSVNGGTGFVQTKVKVLQSGYTYAISINYHCETDEDPILKIAYYDIHREVISESRYNIDHNFEQASYQFTNQTCYYAIMSIGYVDVNNGTMRIDDFKITLISTGQDTSSNWSGDWIWYDEDPAMTCLNDVRYFRYEFDIDQGYHATYAPFQISVDDIYELYVNEVNVVKVYEKHFDKTYVVNHYNIVNSFDIAPFLKEGKNVIAIRAENGSSVAAVLFDSHITLTNGDREVEKVIYSNKDTVTAAKFSSSSYALETEDVNFVGQNYGFSFDLPMSIPAWVKINAEASILSSFSGCRKLGTPPESPWGAVFYDTSLYVSNKINIKGVTVPDSVTAGDTLDLSIRLVNEVKIEQSFKLSVNIFKRNALSSLSSTTLALLDNTDMTSWPVDEEFTIHCSLNVPKFLETGSYTLQLSEAVATITNDDIFDAKFADFNVVGLPTDSSELVSKVEVFNGTPTITLNGVPYSPMMYLRPEDQRYLPGAEEILPQSNILLYSTNSLFLRNLWKSDGTISYSDLDSEIYSTMSANSDAYLMVYINLWAPLWWKQAHPDQIVATQDRYGNVTPGSTNKEVSLASDLYRQESGEILRKIINYITQQSYYNRIFAFKISDGVTHEWMYYGTSINSYPDYSAPGIEGFRNYLRNFYKTEEALRTAWGDPTVTFDSALPPNQGDKYKTSSGEIILNPTKYRNIIDFNLFYSDTAADTFSYYADITKNTCNRTKLVGGYWNYVWNQNGYDGTGQVHTATQKILGCENIDFICSPISYSERLLGTPCAFMTSIDSIQAHGKIYLLEMDNRTSVEKSFDQNQNPGSDYDEAVGRTYTLQDTIDQEKQNIIQCFMTGCGMWFFDMYGHFLNDETLMTLYAALLDEFDYSLAIPDRSHTKDIAVIVDEENYAYETFDTTYNAPYYFNNYNYRMQRTNLAAMGVDYDMYCMSDLVEGLVPEHKVYIMLSPIEVSEAEQQAIEKYCKVKDSTIIWTYLAGYSDCYSVSEDHISELTDINVKVVNDTASSQVRCNVGSSDPYLEGLDNKLYGSATIPGGDLSYPGPYTYVDEPSATSLGKIVEQSDKDGLVYKDVPLASGGTYRSIYSSACNLPAVLLRNIAKEAGIHIYNYDTSNTIYSNDGYVALFSGVSGNKTIFLDGNYAVYDVWKGEYISMCTNRIDFYLEENDTALFRIQPVNTYSVNVHITGQGEISGECLSFIELGGTYITTIKPKEGYEIFKVLVNGEEVTLDENNTLRLDSIDENVRIEIEFTKIIEESNNNTRTVWVFNPLLDDGNIGAVKVFLTICIVGVLVYTTINNINKIRKGSDE